jgi:hypothetical protein
MMMSGYVRNHVSSSSYWDFVLWGHICGSFEPQKYNLDTCKGFYVVKNNPKSRGFNFFNKSFTTFIQFVVVGSQNIKECFLQNYFHS